MNDPKAVSWETCQRTHDSLDCRFEKVEKKQGQMFWLQISSLLGVIGVLGSVLATIAVQLLLAATAG